MDFFTKLVEIADTQMATPTNYDWFHLMWIGIVVVASVLMCVFFKNVSDRTVRIICFVFWITIVLFEIYKQFAFAYEVSDDSVVFDYAWYIFPFQLCSSPLYILPLVAFLPDGRIRDAATTFMIAFSIFGGICVYVFPNDVFCATLGVNIQTMYHHGVQIVSGVFLAARYRKKLNIKYFLKGAVVFAIMMAVAITLNELVHSWLVAGGRDDTFNMFYISRFHPCTLPVLSVIYPLVPYPVFVAIYAVGFCIASALIFYIAKGIAALSRGVARLSKNAA